MSSHIVRAATAFMAKRSSKGDFEPFLMVRLHVYLAETMRFSWRLPEPRDAVIKEHPP
jgi:hypothetical protein